MFYIVYLNDIFIFFRNKEEYIEHLELVIKRLYHTKLYINLKKYEFNKSKVKYLGFFVNS